MGQLTQPVEVEHDGWTVTSASAGVTEADLRAAIGAPDAEAPQAPAQAPASAATPPAAPAQEPPIAEGQPPAPAAAPVGDATEGEPVPQAAGEPTAEGVTPGEPSAEPGKPKKKARSPQERINEAIRAQRAAERERDAERAARADVERRLKALEDRPDRPVAPAAAPRSEPAPPAAQTKPVWAEYEADGKSWDEYQEDREQWVLADATARATDAAEKKIAASRAEDNQTRKVAEAQAAQRAIIDQHIARVDAARAAHPDFGEAMNNLTTIASPSLDEIILRSDTGGELLYALGTHPEHADTLAALFLEAVGANRELRPIVDAFRVSPVPWKLLSHYAEHPEEFRTLTTLDPVLALKALGRLEARLDVAPAATTPSAPPVTRARPPFRPPAGPPNASDRRGPPNLEEMEFGPDYVRSANQQEATARRRRL